MMQGSRRRAWSVQRMHWCSDADDATERVTTSDHRPYYGLLVLDLEYGSYNASYRWPVTTWAVVATATRQ
eukprot:COSAG01_NODE_245_length_20483_cov_32.975314_2_plen_70_part_00